MVSIKNPLTEIIAEITPPGGHYGPIFNEYLEQQNEQIKCGALKGAHYIKLSTLLIGNGWYDPLVQYAAYYNYTVSPGEYCQNP
jgi:carboxypeptidase C (cathepsin A)